MTAFLLFWVFVAANLLSPVPVLGGICVGGVWTTGRVKVAFAVMGAAITALAASVYSMIPMLNLRTRLIWVVRNSWRWPLGRCLL